MQYNKREANSALELRSLKETDHLHNAARLIYQTDDFIYPALFGNCQNAEIILPEIFLQSGHCFGLKNMFTALLDGQVVGLIYYIKHDFIWAPEIFLNKFKQHTIGLPKYFYNVSANYFDKVAHDKEIQHCIYIMNVCVSASVRHMGVGTELLSAFIDRYSSEQMSLHVLSNNASAIHLYTKLGFSIRKETTGYSSNPPPPQCYFMMK